MAHVRPNARWYLAEIVEEITVEDEADNIVHRNLVLIRADSPEEAFEKSVELGKGTDLRYDNPEGKQVHIRFRGLAELYAVCDELDHGAELLYTEDVGVPELRIEQWIRPKEELAVFRADGPRSTPDYSSGEIMHEAKELMRTGNRPENG